MQKVNLNNRLYSDLQAIQDDLNINNNNSLSAIMIKEMPIIKCVDLREMLPLSAYHSNTPVVNKLRIDEMRHRFLSARDLFTGEPLAAQDYDEWAVSFTRDCRRRRFAYENRREEYAKGRLNG